MSKTLQNGSFQDPLGNAVNAGTIEFVLSHDAMIIAGGQVAPTRVTATLDSSGDMPGAFTILANDELTPSGTFYLTTVFDSNGARVFGPERWVLSGSSPIDLDTLTPTIVDPAFANPILSNPAADQAIDAFDLDVLDLNAVRKADQFSGADGGAKIVTAIADLPAAGGTIDARGLEGAQTILSSIAVGTSSQRIILRLGNATFSGSVNPLFTLHPDSVIEMVPGTIVEQTANASDGIDITGSGGLASRGGLRGSGTILGTGGAVSTASGLVLSAPRLQIGEVRIRGFGNGVKFANSAFIIQFLGTIIGGSGSNDNDKNGIGVLAPASLTSFGEGLSFTNVLLANSINEALSVKTTGDFDFTNCSFDSNGDGTTNPMVRLDATNTRFSSVGCHWESQGGSRSFLQTDAAAQVTFIGGQILPTTDQTSAVISVSGASDLHMSGSMMAAGASVSAGSGITTGILVADTSTAHIAVSEWSTKYATNVSTTSSGGVITLDAFGVASPQMKVVGALAILEAGTTTDNFRVTGDSAAVVTLRGVLDPLEGAASNLPRWVFKQVDFGDMTAGATADTFVLYNLPANTMIHDVVGTVVTAWAGGTISAAIASVGTVAGSANDLTLDDDFFATGTRYELHDATANGGKGTLLFDSTDKFAPHMFVAGGNIELQMDLTGDNHANATAGQARIYMLVSQPLGNTVTEAS